MRVVIAFLLIGAVGTSLLAYGPRLSFLESSAAMEAEAAAEAARLEAIRAAAEPEPEPEPDPAVEAARVEPGEAIPGTEELRRVSGTISRSINHTLSSKLERSVADPLTQVVTRILVWWVNPSRDLQPGDELAIVYSLHPGEEPRVHAVSLSSGRHGRTFRAFAFQPEGFKFRRIYVEDGEEVEKKLVGSPIKEYEQITSLLWDGRGHNGVDFKTPVGTETYAPFDGRVMRRNWSTRFNGNCLHIRTDNGTNVLFLHLDSFADGMQPGRRVRKGELVGFSGNTGRSTAPHLHYELQNSAGRILDPFNVHETYRESVPPEQKPAFDSHVAGLRAILEAGEAYASDGS